MPFKVLTLFFPVVLEAALAPANQNGRDDGADPSEEALVGIEAVAKWGVSSAERARSHG